MHQNLVQKYEGPFRIVTKVGKISYKLELPLNLKVILSFMPTFSSHTMKTRVISTEDNQVGRLSQSPPLMTETLRPLSTTKPSRNRDNLTLLCSSFMGRDNLRRRPHRNSTRIYGSLKTMSKNSCSSSALRSSPQQVRENVTTRLLNNIKGEK